MKRIARTLLPILIGLIALTGCQEYDVEVVVEPDGSGSRELVLSTNSRPNGTSEPTLMEFEHAYCLDDRSGWKTVETGKAEEEDSTKSFFGTRPSRALWQRDARATRPTDWARMSGDIRLLGDPVGSRDSEVEFTNRIAVETATDSGKAILTYSEQFEWIGLKEAVAHRQADLFVKQTDEHCPEISPEVRGELRGLMIGAMLMELDLSVRDVDDGEHEALAATITDLALAAMTGKHGAPTPAEMTAIVTRLLADPDGELTDWLEEMLPGAGLGIETAIEISVTLPGEIVQSNADTIDGRTASWTIDILQALVWPVEIFARAEIDG